MKFNIRSLDPHEWRKLVIEEDNRETLVRHFEPASLESAVEVVDAITKIAVEYNLQDQVQFYIDIRRLTIFIHYSDLGPIESLHYQLTSAIDTKLELP